MQDKYKNQESDEDKKLPEAMICWKLNEMLDLDFQSNTRCDETMRHNYLQREVYEKTSPGRERLS